MTVKFCVVLVLACTFLRIAQGIIGADLIKVEDFSYNVVVYVTKKESYYQSGSVIHKRFILTNGANFSEVIWNEDKSSVISFSSVVNQIEIQALTNYPNADSKSQEKNKLIEKVKTLHFSQERLSYNKTYGNLAVLELENDLDLSRGISVLKLPTTNLNYISDNEKFAVFNGYGHDNSDIPEPGGLRAMEVHIVDCPKTSHKARDWSIFCGRAIIFHKNFNNAHSKLLGAYAGDIGGPLVFRKDTIIGMLIRNPIRDDRLRKNHSISFVNISHHLGFINDVISGQPSLHVTVALLRSYVDRTEEHFE